MALLEQIKDEPGLVVAHSLCPQMDIFTMAILS